MSKELIEFDVFDAGLNTKAEPINLLPGQSDYMNNILFGDYGSIMTRGRISTYNSTPITASPQFYRNIQGMHSYRPSTMSAQLVVICAGNAYILTGASTSPAILSGSTGFCSYDEAVNMSEANGLLFLAGAGNMMKKYNGVEFTRAGVSAPTQVLTAVCNAAGGNLNGEYQYVYWGVNSYLAEGDYIATPSPVKTIASGEVRVSNIPTAPASYGIEYWKIGRNTAGASGIFWYLTDKTNGVTSFTDNVADADLDTLAPTDQGYPRVFRFTCVYGGRLWGAVDEYLWYSNIDQPEEFPSTNFIRVGAGSGLRICSIVPFMGMIVISLSTYVSPTYGFDANGDPNNVFDTTHYSPSYSQNTALYVLRIGDSVGFSDPENWYLNLIAQNEGSESNGACIPVAGYLWMTGRSGVSLFNGAGIASGVQDTAVGGIAAPKISDPINTLFSLVTPGHIRLATAIEWKNRIYLSLDKTTGYNGSATTAVNDTTLIYDYSRVGVSDARKGAWSKIDSIGAQKFVVHEDQLLSAGAESNGLDSQYSGSYIYKWDNGTFYNSANALSPLYYRMSAIRGQKNHVYNDKDFRFVNVWASGSGSLFVRFRVNGVDFDSATSIPSSTITLTTAGEKTRINLPAAAHGKHLWIQFEIDTNSGGTFDLNITKVQVFYNLRGLRNA